MFARLNTAVKSVAGFFDNRPTGLLLSYYESYLIWGKKAVVENYTPDCIYRWGGWGITMLEQYMKLSVDVSRLLFHKDISNHHILG